MVSDSDFVIDFMIASEVVTDSASGFVTDLMIESEMVTESDSDLNSTISGSS